jgi:hypothetical protein
MAQRVLLELGCRLLFNADAPQVVAARMSINRSIDQERRRTSLEPGDASQAHVCYGDQIAFPGKSKSRGWVQREAEALRRETTPSRNCRTLPVDM